jgi:hypothetical protein
MRRAARRDANQGEIVGVFQALDCSVLDIASTPCGFDLVVGYKTQAILVEVKDGAKPPSARKLTENEHSAHLNWHGPKAIVKSNAEAVAVAQLLRSRHFAVMESALADLVGA